MGKYKCPKCGTVFEGPVKFCPGCGQELKIEEKSNDRVMPAAPKQKYKCPKCGTIFEEGVKFCPGCGVEITTKASKTPKEEPAPAPAPVETPVVEETAPVIEEPKVEVPQEEIKTEELNSSLEESKEEAIAPAPVEEGIEEPVEQVKPVKEGKKMKEVKEGSVVKALVFGILGLSFAVGTIIIALMAIFGGAGIGLEIADSIWPFHEEYKHFVTDFAPCAGLFPFGLLGTMFDLVFVILAMVFTSIAAKQRKVRLLTIPGKILAIIGIFIYIISLVAIVGVIVIIFKKCADNPELVIEEIRNIIMTAFPELEGMVA